jgi:hypothetical protein
MTDYFNFHTIATLLTALALGGMVYFSFLVAPTTFRVLGRDRAPPLISAFFRLYYPFIAITTAAAAALIFYRGEAVVLALVAAVAVVGLLAIRPAVERLREGRKAGDDAATRKFRQLHGISMILNLLQMAALFIVFLRLIRQ